MYNKLSKTSHESFNFNFHTVTMFYCWSKFSIFKKGDSINVAEILVFFAQKRECILKFMGLALIETPLKVVWKRFWRVGGQTYKTLSYVLLEKIPYMKACVACIQFYGVDEARLFSKVILNLVRETWGCGQKHWLLYATILSDLMLILESMFLLNQKGKKNSIAVYARKQKKYSFVFNETVTTNAQP